ncbi:MULTISPECIES: DUF6880 family protein [unclassified Paraburkholderia]|uniref:DUF6880 family protein n=1 Tax=unclassified Paraburkholderia TaxID=2615204 RepID=UPI0016231753|nr:MULTISPECIES: DUF6880 family protein [unclassified Paraburkholderia]MBB5445633.1 flagellin-specific chaperone FliS [Paraburkholderia sp. WSM4177]MBB5486315.1 flagellin-specific chaperone FliS [Paraburkholderia sp. WSM4180]
MSNEENPIDVKALVTLGPERLATLLAEAAMMNLCMRRRLQFELSAQKKENVSETVHRWISDLSEHTSFLDAEQVDELARELEAMRAAIVSNVSRAAPKLAPDLMWQFFTLAGTVYERTTEEGWEVSRVFDQACADLVRVSVDAEVEPKLFAARVVSAISSNDYAEYSALIPAIAFAQPWASAYVSEIRALLQRLLDDPRGPNGSPNSEHSRILQRALRELDSPSTA